MKNWAGSWFYDLAKPSKIFAEQDGWIKLRFKVSHFLYFFLKDKFNCSKVLATQPIHLILRFKINVVVFV